MTTIRLKRVYEEPEPADGYRVLVDRLWPRGLKKEEVPYDLWIKNLAPSNTIRKTFDHKEEKFSAFKKEYLLELNENPERVDFIEAVSKALQDKNVTLLYAAKNPEFNQAIILKEWLEKSIKSK